MPTTEGFKQRAASFLSDTSGPSVTLMLAASVGTSVLALDCGRYTSLQTQLQKGADALAKIIRFRFFSWAGSWGLAILAHRAQPNHNGRGLLVEGPRTRNHQV